MYFLFKRKIQFECEIEGGGASNCCISEITLAELKYGAECSNRILENKEMIDGLTKELTILPIFNSLNIYAKEKARLRKSGKILDDFDLLIGATAIANNLILVTENEKHLSRMSKINFESWINR
ncbi:MAG: PIN domain-containing protein [Methylococcaceae bacterium]